MGAVQDGGENVIVYIDPIPADIAQKLGIEPKEVNNAEHTTH